MGRQPIKRDDDRWHLGSLTKAFTATLAGVLVERGMISWDAVTNSAADRSAVAVERALELLVRRAEAWEAAFGASARTLTRTAP